jgi:hypothetical protein
MILNNGFQYVLLVQGDINEQDMLALVELFLEAFEVRMGLLNTNQATLPGTKTEHDNREKYGGHPGIGFGETGKPGEHENGGGGYYADDGAYFGAVYDILLENSLNFMQVVCFHARIILAQYMNLRRTYSRPFQVLLDNFKIIEIIANKVVAFHTAFPFGSDNRATSKLLVELFLKTHQPQNPVPSSEFHEPGSEACFRV